MQSTDCVTDEMPRLCFRNPVPQVLDAARYLDAAVSAHLAKNTELAEYLIRAANMDEVREWTESLWGKASQYVKARTVPGAPPKLLKNNRIPVRMPSVAEKKMVHLRDGFHCRFCGVPVIRAEIRTVLAKNYPDALPWGKTNAGQHAAFQALWAQYDHVLAHARGGDNSLENTVLTCAPCNFGKMNHTVEELNLIDPRKREPVKSMWDGLERLLNSPLS
ncbi:hypothetical protein PSCICN_08450 [Pseudomonas cichorii]|uniref:HNH endonuclease n=1 Tax=Pseudomonas cichorii TaxID=36746 RepID=UPI0019F6595F|nr:HNH endonuclease domain-containing protein [Pseudomonas cichorii]GFM80153.1 hypothetical protein PSCICN_08450 [Pseudomonas cichorii]